MPKKHTYRVGHRIRVRDDLGDGMELYAGKSGIVDRTKTDNVAAGLEDEFLIKFDDGTHSVWLFCSEIQFVDSRNYGEIDDA